MRRFQPLFLALCLGLTATATASLAATDMNGTGSRPQADHSRDNTPAEGSSVNDPGTTPDNDSSGAGLNGDAIDGATGGSNSTGEATGSGAGASGGTAEDQDSR